MVVLTCMVFVEFLLFDLAYARAYLIAASELIIIVYVYTCICDICCIKYGISTTIKSICSASYVSMCLN